MGKIIKYILINFTAVGLSSVALAAPTIDSINVQGYMKKSNGSAVTDGTYTLAFGVFQNGVNIWGRSYSVVVTNGLFSRTLSGVGGDLSALPAPTGINSDFSATGSNTTLDAALLVAGGAGGISVRVYAVSLIDSVNPQFDIAVAAVPTAFISEVSKGVTAGAVTVAGIATGSKVSTSAGAADVGKLALLDANGKFDSSFIPATITGGAGASFQSSAGNTTTIGNASTTSDLALQSGTGGITAAVTGVSGNVSFTAGSASGNVTLTPGSAGQVAIGSASTGTATFGNTGTDAVTTVQGGSGALGSVVVTSAGTSATAVSLSASNATGGITIQPAAGGSGTITVGSTSTGASLFGNTGAASATTIQGATVNLGAGATTTTAAVGGAGLTTLNIGTAATGDLVTTIGSTAGASATTIQAGTAKVKIGSTGTAFTAMGGCTVASVAITNTAANRTCTGVPASTAVAVWCSGSAAMQTPNTTAIYCRAQGGADTIVCNTTVGNTTAMTWNCMWLRP